MEKKECTYKIVLIISFFLVFTSAITVKAQMFTKITPPVNNFAYGCGWIDYNNDNYLDAYQSSYGEVFLNKGDNSFELVNNSEITPQNEGVGFSGICWGDYDNNGFNDLFITNMLTGANDLYSNLGNGHFEKIINTVMSKDKKSCLDANWIDYDNDGFLDLLASASGTGFSPGSGNGILLYKNNGNGTFTKIETNGLAEIKTSSDCAAFADIDNDGDQDLFMTEWINSNWMLENNGDGTFKRTPYSTINQNGNTSITASWGDYDNDGFLDLFVGNGSTSNTLKQKNFLFHNNGNKTFSHAASSDIVNYAGCVWSSAWGDVDNDGDLDLFAGTISDEEQVLFINNGDGTFKNTHEFSADSLGVTGVSFGDYDNDGAIDLQVATFGNPFIYHNNGNNNNWIIINCRGIVSNRSAIGARIKIKANIFGKTYWQIREIHTKQGFRGSNDLRAHFGLGDATVIDSLVIIWPSGIQNVRTNIPVDQCLQVQESVPEDFFKAQFISDNIIAYSAQEIQFTDLSISGTPITSWSWDFNDDGIEDSNEKNPTYLFDEYDGKEFTVRLIISNGTGTDTLTKKNYIKLLPAYSENIALMKNVTASTSVNEAKHPPLHAIDGEIGTYWQSVSGADSQWIKVELDKEFNISKLYLQWGTLFAKKYDVLVSRDGEYWFCTKSADNLPGRNHEIKVDPILAKFIKINMYESSSASGGYRINELEIYQPEVMVKVDEKAFIPCEYQLFQNYPNPFNPKTNFKFRISASLAGKSNFGLTTFKIFDILGNEVATLVNEEKAPGEYQIKFDASRLSSGVYFYQLKSGNFVQTKKMVLLK